MLDTSWSSKCAFSAHLVSKYGVVIRPEHGVGFSASRLAVNEDSAVEPVDKVRDEVARGCLIHRVLRRPGAACRAKRRQGAKS